jgi:hypothetical protein
LLVDVVQTFGKKISPFRLDHFPTDVELLPQLATRSPLIPGLPRFAKALPRRPAKIQHRISLGNSVPDFRRHLSPRKSLSVLARSASCTFNLCLGWRTPDKANRLPLRIDQLDWALAATDSFGNFFVYRYFSHDSLLG